MQSKTVFVSLLLIGSGWALVETSAVADPPSRESIAKLTPEEKTSLLQKKERFDALPLDEQKRLRELNTSIAASANGEQLHTTLDRYHEWLKTLTTKQRADLLELPADKRVDRIKELMQEQERARLRDLGGKQLPEPDIDAIFNWLDDFMKQHEDQYLDRLPEEYRTKLKNQEEVSRRRSLMRGIIMRGPRSDFPLPMQKDFEQLLPTLSAPTRAVLDSAKTPEEKQQLARQWIFSAMISKVLPPASEEDLRQVFKDLTDEHRERLERKSPEEVKRELTWRFHWKQGPGREGWRGPGGPSGFRPGGPGGPGGNPERGAPGRGPGNGERPPRGDGESRDRPKPPLPEVKSPDKQPQNSPPTPLDDSPAKR